MDDELVARERELLGRRVVVVFFVARELVVEHGRRRR